MLRLSTSLVCTLSKGGGGEEEKIDNGPHGGDRILI